MIKTPVDLDEFWHDSVTNCSYHISKTSDYACVFTLDLTGLSMYDGKYNIKRKIIDNTIAAYGVAVYHDSVSHGEHMIASDRLSFNICNDGRCVYKVIKHLITVFPPSIHSAYLPIKDRRYNVKSDALISHVFNNIDRMIMPDFRQAVLSRRVESDVIDSRTQLSKFDIEVAIDQYLLTNKLKKNLRYTLLDDFMRKLLNVSNKVHEISVDKIVTRLIGRGILSPVASR